MVHTGQQLRGHAREMRRAPTRSENRLWSWLRDRRFDGYKFKRQFPIGRYVLDFYCAELKLAIEVDGQQHSANWMVDYEYERTNALRERGIEVLRIPNELLIRDGKMTEQLIRWAIERSRR
jgi:very-short-patch-repair endonuclease